MLRHLPALLVVAVLLLPSVGLSAQGTRLLRQPTVSDREIAFSYAGDIWIASREGGDARRLTSAPGMEGNPHFSPDGRYIAYSGEYAGNWDSYVVEATGGSRRGVMAH